MNDREAHKPHPTPQSCAAAVADGATAKPYNDYSSWIRRQFDFRVQKISIDAGFTCPNRDGRLSRGGCTFCDNRTFSPQYCGQGKSIAQQLAEGKAFFARKYPGMRYLAYFQAYSNTYAPIDVLRRRYEEALAADGVVGLVIGTRPDAIDDAVLDYLEELNRQTFLIVEYGIESANDDTLLRVNRGHTFACSRQAFSATHQRGIRTGGHVIIGLPGEDEDETLRQARDISSLDIDLLKIHQMQIIRGTPLAAEYARRPFRLYTADEYIRLVTAYVERLRKDIVIERFVSQSPAHLLIGPKWGLKNHEFTARLEKHMKAAGAFQGRLYTE